MKRAATQNVIKPPWPPVLASLHMDALFDVDTDVATIALFHPDDLAHRAADPIAWYAYEFAYRAESAAGRLVAFVTGADNGYTVRVTDGALRPAEAQFACASWTYPLVVRRGRVLLDNTDALPSAGALPASLVELTWIELGNGAYRVTVVPIQHVESPEDPPSDLPDYVIVMVPVADISEIAVAPTPPDLRQDPNWAPRPMTTPVATEDGHRWPNSTVQVGEYPALHVSDSAAVLPRQQAHLAAADLVDPAAVYASRRLLETCVVAGNFNVGDLAVLSRYAGLSASNRQLTSLQLTGLAVVRVTSVPGPGPLAPVRVEPVAAPDLSAAIADVEPLRATVLARARAKDAFLGHLRHRHFHLEELAALESVEAITTWMLFHLPMSLATRVALYASAVPQRAVALEGMLATG